MDNNNRDDFNKRLKRTIYFTTFTMFFFHFFAPLLIIGVVMLIAGAFKREFLYIGAVLLVLDAVLSLFMMIRGFRAQSKHSEYERFRRALAGEDFMGDMDKLDSEWAGSGFYSARVGGYRDDAAECKTVGEVFDVYKRHCMSVVTGQETYTFSTGPDKKYFTDGGSYYVISFDRMRVINDDVECHMYFDLLFDPDKMGRTRIVLSSENYGDTIEGLESFLQSVEDYLKDKDLMEVPVGKMNVGTDE